MITNLPFWMSVMIEVMDWSGDFSPGRMVDSSRGSSGLVGEMGLIGVMKDVLITEQF